MDFKKFENLLREGIIELYNEILEENDKVYSLAICDDNFFNGMFISIRTEEIDYEDGDWYDIYDPEEFDIFDPENDKIDICKNMILEYLDKFDLEEEFMQVYKFKDEVIDIYIYVLKELRESVFKGKINLDVSIRDYFREEDMIEIFGELNDEKETKIYAKLLNEE